MKLAKKIRCFVLCLIMIAASCFVSIPVRAAEMAEYGTIVNSSNGVNVRAQATASSNRVGGLNTGERVKLLDLVSSTDTANPKWYKIQAVSNPNLVGFVSAAYVREDAPQIEYVPEADFEEYLTKQGFPESYKPMLRNLHANYPNWVFIADHLEMTWDEALTAESKVGVSLIENSVDDAWKSKEYGAYNWETGSYVIFDSGGWVAAHKSVVAYYLDPRNFLNSTDIFQFFMQTYVPELQTLDGLKKLVSGTFLANNFPEDTYATYCDVLMEAAKQSGVSPYVLASMILTEQGTNGQGNSISGNVSGYKGYYNFFNVSAYAHSGRDAVVNGLIYASSGTSYLRPWNTRAKAIIGGATWYFDEYVNPATSGGYTIYYKKFDVKKYPWYTFQYMTNIRGAAIEGAKSANGYSNEDLKKALEFRIPVYKSMPNEISPLPPKTGSNDNYLTELAVTGHPFTTEFSKWENNYGVIVDNEVTTATITAKASDSKATVAGTGQFALVVGTNRFDVVVTSTSGQKRTYTIVITRKEKEVEKPAEPSIETTDYSVGKFITGIALDTTAEGFIQKLNVKNGTAKLFNADGSEKQSGVIGTGNTVKIYDLEGTEKLSYQIVIYGDTNGDGKINSVDIAVLQRHILELKTLENCYFEACDVTRDSRGNSVDIARIQRHILELSLIEQ